jgi:hypothetical protein
MAGYEAVLDGAGRETPKYSQVLEAKQNSTWKVLRSKRHRRRERLASNHLSHSTTQN